LASEANTSLAIKKTEMIEIETEFGKIKLFRKILDNNTENM